MTSDRDAITRPVYYPSDKGENEKLCRKRNNNDHLASPKFDLSLVDPLWETMDPTPNIHELFVEFDSWFFGGKLKSVEVRWSNRLTVCAGVCSYEGNGGLCSIRLSEPLLKLRPRSDLVETLLHEMIHAYLFVTRNFRDRSDHGPKFQYHMRRINGCAGTNITIYHSFHDEVENYRQHWWKCDGPCARRPPYFGLVKRTVNRAPGPNDLWWSEHQATCMGQFVKVKEPVDYKDKRKKAKTEKENVRPIRKTIVPSSDIRQFITIHSGPSSSNDSSNSCPFKVDIDVSLLDMVECPVCQESVPLDTMNNHLDKVHFA